MSDAPDVLTLLIGGVPYSGWTEIRVSRGLTKCVTDFDIAVSERWSGQDEPWKILPFVPCQIMMGDDPLLTGYVDVYSPQITATSHAVRVKGRSKTQDLVECSPDIPSGQFSGYALAAIARSLCALFGIGVIVQTDQANQVVANAQIERCETAWTFLERLCRLAGVLATDDANGNLVLTVAGATRSSGRLVEGETMRTAQATLSSAKRFSDYIVKGQARIGGGGGGTIDSYGGLGGIAATTPTAPSGAVQTQMRGTAHDSSVPRYRPHVSIAESQLSPAQMQERANWQMIYAYGQSTKATIGVQGWRQPDGTLWAINQMIGVTSKTLGVDQDLLVVETKFALDDRGGHITELLVGPVEGYTPDPGQVKLRKKRGRKGRGGGSGVNWTGFGGSAAGGET
jgi:prophage tail gpP-like protein